MPSAMEFERYFLMFFTLSVAGWCMEVTCKYVQFGRFINRGFLLGPYCPIYGVGSVLILLLLSEFADRPLAVFLLAMVVCGTLEYITSYLMEKLFQARWWDYSNRRFNLNGRVCANTLIPFGLLGLVLVYWIEPLLLSLFNQLSDGAMHALCIGLTVLMLADSVISVMVLGKIRKSVNHTAADDTEALTKAVREKLSQQSVLLRRMLSAFPYLKLYNSKLLQQMKRKREELKRETIEKAEKIRGELDEYETRMRDFYRSKRMKK